MIIRATSLLVLVSVFVVGMLASAGAGVLNYSTAYWYWADDAQTQIATVFNTQPDLDRLVVKVQQTVYDDVWSRSILTLCGEDISEFGDDPIYLYVYTVHNVAWWADGGAGLTEFEVDWGAPCLKVTKAKGQMMQSWSSSMQGTNLLWTYSGDNIGIIPGSAAGGFWAVASTSVSGPTNAVSRSNAGDSIEDGAKVIGPSAVPEPASIIALVFGAVGLCAKRYRRV